MCSSDLVKVARVGVLGPDAKTDLLEPAVPDRQADRSEHLLLAREDRDVRVPDRQSIEDVVAGGHHVEQPVVSRPVEDHLAVARGLDGDRPLGRAFERQRHGAVERRHHGIDVAQTFRLVEACVDKKGVAGLRAPFPYHAPVPQAGAVIRLQDAREARLDALPLIPRWINMQNAAVLRRLRFRPRFHPDRLGRLAAAAVGIREREAALVLGRGLKAQDAARETVRHGVVEVFAAAVHMLAAHPKVTSVRYPGLPDHPGHALALRQP